MSAYAFMGKIRGLWHRVWWRLQPPRLRPTGERQRDGLAGELAAARFLKTHGYRILVRRYRCRYGEIDLVCRDSDTLVFVEVKARRNDEVARPSDSVGADKQRHLSRAALDYLRRLGHPEVAARFDVVEVVLSTPRPSFHLIQDAFGLAKSYQY